MNKKLIFYLIIPLLILSGIFVFKLSSNPEDNFEQFRLRRGRFVQEKKVIRKKPKVLDNSYFLPVVRSENRSDFELKISTFLKNGVQKKYSFQLKSLAFFNDNFFDSEEGEVIVDGIISSANSSLNFKLQSDLLIPMRFSVAVDTKKMELKVPVFEKKKWPQLKNLGSDWSALLVELSASMENVVLSADYKQLVLLNKNLEIVEDDDEWSYLLFLGLKEGLITIEYEFFDGKKSTKVTSVVNGELYYDNREFYSPFKEESVVIERGALGIQKSEGLILGQYNIHDPYTGFKSKVLGPNKIETYRQVTPLGERRYLSFKVDGKEFYLGTAGQNMLEIPSPAYMNVLYDMIPILKEKDQCFIQFNFSKGVVRNDWNFVGKRNPKISFFYLQEDGTITYEPNVEAEKMIATSDSSGEINLRFDYEDGSSEYVKSFCISDQIYLIEHL